MLHEKEYGHAMTAGLFSTRAASASFEEDAVCGAVLISLDAEGSPVSGEGRAGRPVLISACNLKKFSATLFF